MANVNPPGLAPPVQGVYSQISIAPVGRLAFIAGQVAIDADGTLVGKGDHVAQARQCFRNLAIAIEACGARPDQVVKMTINVVDHNDSRVGPIFAVGAEVFGGNWPVCASTFLGVQALGMEGWLVEVDAIVSLPNG